MPRHALVVVSLLVIACGSDDSEPGKAHSGGAAGTGGVTSGGGLGGVGGSGGGGGSSTGGSGGIAGAGSGGIAGAMTTGGTGGSAGAAACSEQPCKLVAPQCGCASGQACVLLGTTRSCAPAGTVAEGLECNATGSCQPGFGCYNMNGLSPTCTKYCADNTDCQAPGGVCIDKNIGAKVCTQNCDPLTGTGCAAAGTKCSVAIHPVSGPLTSCSAAGTKQVGESCGGDATCVAGTSCFSTTSPTTLVCLAWCDVATPSCPSGSTCMAFATVGTVQYGYCKPN